MSEPTSTLTLEEVYTRLEAVTSGHGKSKAWAQEHKISESHLCDVLKRRRKPAGKILAALGLEPAGETEPLYRETVAS